MHALLAWAQRYRRLLALLLCLVLLGLVAQVTGLRAQLTVVALQGQLQAAWQVHPASGVALFVVAFCLGNLLQVPGWIFLAAAVFVLGRSHGGLLTYAAAVSSCLFTFVAVRLVGGNVAATLKSALAQRLVAQLQAHPVRNVAALRMLFQTLPPLNYALALSGLRLRHYALGTLLGLPLPIAVYCVFF